MECILTDIDSLCNKCGHFDNDSPVNGGFGCKHPYCSDGDYIDFKGNFAGYLRLNRTIAMSFTRRNIKCNRRLAKKFLKKARGLSFQEQKKILKSKRIKYYGKCLPFTCSIAWEPSFENLKDYINHKEFDHIESEKEMPCGWGDDLMGIEKIEADKLGINY